MKIRRILAVSAIIAAAAAGTVFAVNAAPVDKIGDVSAGELYIFDVEPMQTGRYYLNGDTEKCYLELTESTIQYIGTREQTEELISLGPPGLDTGASPDQPGNILADWSEPKQYYLYRFAHFPDKVMLAWDINTDENGTLLGGAGSFIDEERKDIINYCGCNFIYVG